MLYLLIQTNTKGSHSMTYTITLETFNGSTKKINLASRGAVAQFISTYPTQLPVGVSVKVACDSLGIRGTLRGKAVL
jgi:hypothetical protein